jgi:hypothetical protein
VADFESDAGLDLSVAASGDEIQVTATGLAATEFSWFVHADVYEDSEQ